MGRLRLLEQMPLPKASTLPLGLRPCSSSHSFKGAFYTDMVHHGLCGSKGQTRTPEVQLQVPSSHLGASVLSLPPAGHPRTQVTRQDCWGLGTFPLLQAPACLETLGSHVPLQAHGNIPGQGELSRSPTPRGHAGQPACTRDSPKQPTGLRQPCIRKPQPTGMSPLQ